MIESRKPIEGKTSPLPLDFLKLVNEILNANFGEGLKLLQSHGADFGFESSGFVLPTEVLLSISIKSDALFQSTTVHASTDFDPKASLPSTQDLLHACLDAAGSVLSDILNPKKPKQIEALTSNSLAAFEDIPWDWTAMETPLASTGSARVYLKVDKSRPTLDQAAEDWLKTHDPDYEEQQKAEQKATEELFVTGEKAKKTVH